MMFPRLLIATGMACITSADAAAQRVGEDGMSLELPSLCQAAEQSKAPAERLDAAQLRERIRIPIGGATLMEKSRDTRNLWQKVEGFASIPPLLLNGSAGNSRFVICAAEHLVHVGTSRTINGPFRLIERYRIDVEAYVLRWPEGSPVARARFTGTEPLGTAVFNENTTALFGVMPGTSVEEWFENLMDPDSGGVIAQPGTHVDAGAISQSGSSLVTRIIRGGKYSQTAWAAIGEKYVPLGRVEEEVALTDGTGSCEVRGAALISTSGAYFAFRGEKTGESRPVGYWPRVRTCVAVVAVEPAIRVLWATALTFEESLGAVRFDATDEELIVTINDYRADAGKVRILRVADGSLVSETDVVSRAASGRPAERWHVGELREIGRREYLILAGARERKDPASSGALLVWTPGRGVVRKMVLYPNLPDGSYLEAFAYSKATNEVAFVTLAPGRSGQKSQVRIDIMPLQGGEPRHQFQLSGAPTDWTVCRTGSKWALAFSVDGSKLAFSCRNGRTWIYDRTGVLLTTVSGSLLDSTGPGTSLGFYTGKWVWVTPFP